MATAETLSCRVCCSFMSSTHCIAVFSRESMRSGLAERLSVVLDVPVVPNDGLSKYICRPCNRKFLAAESLRVLAKASYDKCRAVQARPPSVHVGSPKSSKVAPRKRSKDTSGIGVSPHTHRARPPAKRQTGGTSGQRRLSFPVQGESKTMFTNSYKIILKELFPIATVPSESHLALRDQSNVLPAAVTSSHQTTTSQQPDGISV